LYKLVVLDVDDTIVTKTNKLSKATVRAVAAVKERGIGVTLASGRMYQTMRRLAGALEIKMPLISCNGALVRDDKKILFCRALPPKAAQAALDFFNAQGLVLQLYGRDGLYTKRKCAATWRLEQKEGLCCRVVADECYDNFCRGLLKMLLRVAPDEAAAHQKAVAEHFAGRLNAAVSHGVCLEITGRGATKGKALAALAERYGIRREDVLAIGDSPNDRAMLEWAGLGVAMGNAAADVLAAADEVTLPIGEDGAAYALEKYILNEG
jgi:Cof subfamily protein (haloacid dehalogenase superfamily)